MVPGIRWNCRKIVEAQAFRECRPSARDTRLDSPDRNIEDLGDLSVVEVGNITQHDGRPEIFGECVESIVEDQPIAHVLQAFFGHWIDYLGDKVAVFSVSDRVECWSAFAFAELVERSVCRDAICPRAERGTTVETRKVPRDLDQRLLAGVVGVSGTSSDPPTDCMDPVVVKAQKLVERVSITALGGSNECLVIWWSRDEPDRNEQPALAP